MKNKIIKDKIIKVLCVILIFCFCFCIYMERNYSRVRFVEADMTEEEILAEMPEIAISEEDYALEAYILSLPEVQELLENAEEEEFGAAFPNEESEVLLADWIPEGWKVMELAAKDNRMYVSFINEGVCSRYYSFSSDGSYPMQKTVGIYRKTWRNLIECKSVYQNTNGEITKYVDKNEWFSWVDIILHEWM